MLIIVGMASFARPANGFAHRPVYKLSEPSPRSSDALVSLPMLGSAAFTKFGISKQLPHSFPFQPREQAAALANGWLPHSGLSLRAVKQPFQVGAAPVITTTLTGFSNTVGSSSASNASTELEMEPEMTPTAPTTVWRHTTGGRVGARDRNAPRRTTQRATPSAAAAVGGPEDDLELVELRKQFVAATKGLEGRDSTKQRRSRAATADAIDPRLSPPLTGTSAIEKASASSAMSATMPNAKAVETPKMADPLSETIPADGRAMSAAGGSAVRSLKLRASKKAGGSFAGAAARYAAEMAARAEVARRKSAEASEIARQAAAESKMKRASEAARQIDRVVPAEAGAPSASASSPSLTSAVAVRDGRGGGNGITATSSRKESVQEAKAAGDANEHSDCDHNHGATHDNSEAAGAVSKSLSYPRPKKGSAPTSPRGFGKIAANAPVPAPPKMPPNKPAPVTPASQAAAAIAAERAAAAKAAILRAEAKAAANEPPSPEQREKAAAAAARAAKRLSEGESPVLTIELSTVDRSEGSKAEGVTAAGRAEKAEPLEKETEVSISTAKGSVSQKLPSTIERAVANGAAARLTNTSGGPVLGFLSVGGAKVAFAMYEAHARVGVAAEAAAAAGGPGSKFLDAVKGLGLSVANVKTSFTAANTTALSGAFVSHPNDGLPQQKVTVVDHVSGVAIEASMVYQGGRRLRAYCRRATVAEVRRAEALDQLRDAEEKTSYDLLHGRIVAARARGVEARRLEQAQARLKTLQPDVASKEELVQALKWENVTYDEAHQTGEKTGEIVCDKEGCAVGADLEGSRLEFETRAAELALTDTMKKLLKEKSEFGADPEKLSPDRWLFEQIANAAAAAAAEGGVWRSGGKFILSAITRNQSPVALNRYLNSIGQRGCADGIDSLVKWTESHYNKHVSAVQINIHIDSSSFHAQHRDIYGLEQRDMAGRDCTCSFKPNIATACLSIGSTRRCLVEAETDEFSQKKMCCEECKGYHCSHWLRSGSLMYFNDVWNKSHTHGIPQNAGDADETGRGGPRISVALLCAAAEDDPLSLTCGFKPKNIYSTLIDKQAEAKLLKLGLAPLTADGR